MAGALRPLRVNTVEMLRQPGVRREIDVAIGADDLGVDDERAAARPVRVDVVAESTVDGIVVTGHLRIPWRDECRRCLRPLELETDLPVDELYQHEVSDPDAFEIGPDVLDLTPLVRDGTLLVLADPPPLCRDDCAGMCPSCGVDRNSEPCDCDTEIRDQRWAALDDLQLDE